MNPAPPTLFHAILAIAFALSATPLHAQEPASDKNGTPSLANTAQRFHLGPGPAPEGFVRIAVDQTYDPENGVGYDLGTGGQRPSPFFFSVKVPEGNHRVTVAFGGAPVESRTTLRAESARLMDAEVVAPAGQTVTRTYLVNVRRPTLPPPPRNAPGGTLVHMFLPGEAESLNWDEKLTLEFNGPSLAVQSIVVEKAGDVPTAFVAGDSTVGDPRRGPGGNWPTQMAQFFLPEIAVSNHGSGGETTKSFLTGYRLDKVLEQMRPGDFLLLQFGHNDSKSQWPQSYTEPGTTFDAYLAVYIAEVRRRGGIPVLISPMERRQNGDTVGAWGRAMRAVAEKEGVAFIGQWSLSKQLWTALGPDVGTAFTDQTHLSGYGGYLLARLIVGEIRQRVPELARFVRPDFVPMPPSSPASPPAYLSQSPGPGASPRRAAAPAPAP